MKRAEVMPLSDEKTRAGSEEPVFVPSKSLLDVQEE